MFEIKNFTPRSYQESISETCIKKNTLVVIPTGLGKTKTAILVTIKRLKQYPNSKILFLTPTKPLADQIRKEFSECTTIENNEIAIFTGEINPAKREEIEKNSRIIVSTPQTIANDIINSKINLSNYSLLVLDEAHRGVKNYDYTWICKQYDKKSKYPRIIGLTASPGTDMAGIEEVCKNAFIEEIEVRTEEDEDVSSYIQKLNIDWIKVDLPEEYIEVKNFLDNCYESKLSALRSMNLTGKKDFSKKELLSLLGGLQGQIARGRKDFQMMRGISLLAEAIKVQHALEMLETQGINSLNNYMEEVYLKSEKTKTKSIRNLVKDYNFHAAYIKSKELKNKNIQHPKIHKLIETIKREIKPGIKAIIFNQYRDSAKLIESELEKIENIKPRIFVGQQKKKGTGLSQKKQLELIQDFEKGDVNVLISTNIGEEGLDIPNVDLVIFFEPVPSAIRTIQRRGRTARNQEGKVIVLMTKNTRDETYYWVAYHKEKRMFRALKEIKNKLKRKEETNIFSYEKESPTMYIDSRESNSNLVKTLVNQGIKVKTKNLNVGDYILSERVAVERKTVKDFVNSIIDKRLFFQLKNLREKYTKPLIIIEGEEDIYSVRNIHPNSIRGTLASIAISYNIPIIYTKNEADTAELLKIILKRENDDKKEDYPVIVGKTPLTTKDQQEMILESLPGIGPLTAKSLLKKFSTLNNVFNATTEELESLEGIGKKKAENIKKILNENY